MYELIIAFDLGNEGYGVSESPIFNFFFPGEHAPGFPTDIIHAFRADSQLVSPVAWCLMFSYKETKYL